MDINKLGNIKGNNINKANGTSEGAESQDKRSPSSADSTEDKVSLNDYQFRDNDRLFAKLELEKLQEKSGGRMREMKSKVNAYLEAKKNPEKSAEDTEIGQKLNAPSTWEDIADKMLQ